MLTSSGFHEASAPMIDVVCQGTSFEMGRAQGAALRSKILAARKALRALEAFRKQQPWWLPFPVYRWLAGRKARQFLAHPLRHHYPEFDQRLTGLAAGARVKPSTLYLFNALEPMLSYIG